MMLRIMLRIFFPPIGMIFFRYTGKNMKNYDYHKKKPRKVRKFYFKDKPCPSIAICKRFQQFSWRCMW